MALFSQDEWTARYIEALGQVGEEGIEIQATHSHRKSDKPRISSLGSCGRQTFYECIGAPETDPSDPTSNWAQMLGTAGQAVATAVLEKMGYTVTDVEKTVGLFPQNHGVLDDRGELHHWQNDVGDWVPDPDYLIPGHIDGKITGLDLGDEVRVLDVKLRNTFGMYGTNNSPGMAPMKAGLPAASPDVYLQLQTYAKAEEADGCMVLLAPFDTSANKIAAYTKKAHDNGTQVPPAYRLLFDSDEKAQALGIARGRMIAAAVKLAKSGERVRVQREFNPVNTNFPCNWCSRKGLCLVEGPEYDIGMPGIPDEWRVANFTNQHEEVPVA